MKRIEKKKEREKQLLNLKLTIQMNVSIQCLNLVSKLLKKAWFSENFRQK